MGRNLWQLHINKAELPFEPQHLALFTELERAGVIRKISQMSFIFELNVLIDLLVSGPYIKPNIHGPRQKF